MWQLYRVPLWRQFLEWWQGLPGEPLVMRRRSGTGWETRPLDAADHAMRRAQGEMW